MSANLLPGEQGGTGISSALIGDIGKVIKVLSVGPLVYELATDTGGVPAAPNKSLQFNNAGAFGGDSQVLYNSTTRGLTLGDLSDPNSQRLFVGELANNNADSQAIRGRMDVANTLSNSASYYGLFFPITNQGSTNTINGEFFGSYSLAVNTEPRTIANLSGVTGAASLNAGVTTTATALRGIINMGGGTNGTVSGLWIPAFNNAGGTIATAYGVKIDAPGMGGNQYSLGVTGGFTYLNDAVHIGSSAFDVSFTLKVTGAVATSGGGKTAVNVVAGAHTGISSDAFNDVIFDFDRTVNFLGDGGGVPFDIYNFQINAVTYSSDDLQDLGIASTVKISGAPVALANITIATPLALYVASGNVAFANSLRIGSSVTPTATLDVTGFGKFTHTFTPAAGVPIGIFAEFITDPSANGTSAVGGVFRMSSATSDNSNFTQIAGAQFIGRKQGGGTVTANLFGGVFDAVQAGSGLVTSAIASTQRLFVTSTGNVTFGYHQLFASPDISGGGVIQNLVGLYSNPMTAGTVTNYFILYDNTTNGFYVTGTGSVGIGVLVPTQKLDVAGSIKTNATLIMEETGAGTDTITIQAPAAIGASYTLTLPVDDGAVGEVLTTDGSGVLSWSTPGAGDITAVGDVPSGAAFNGTQGTTLTFFNGGGNMTVAYDGTTLAISKTLKPSANDGAALGISGTAFSDLFLASGGVINWAAGDVSITHATDSLALAGATVYSITQAVGASGAPTGFTYTAGAQSNYTANTDIIGVLWEHSATINVNTGAINLVFAERHNRFMTVSAVGATTVDGMIGTWFQSSPTPSTNVTVGIQIGTYFGVSEIYGSLGFVALYQFSNTAIANGVGNVTTLAAIYAGDLGETLGLGNTTATLENFNCIRIEPNTLTSDTNTRTVTNPDSVYIGGAPIADMNIAFTEIACALHIAADPSRFDGRVLESQGSDVASANNLTLGGDGNCWTITGTTTINGIFGTNWINGSLITLRFDDVLTVKHGTGGGGTREILLAGAADFLTSNNDTLTLRLMINDGVPMWHEIARTVI